MAVALVELRSRTRRYSTGSVARGTVFSLLMLAVGGPTAAASAPDWSDVGAIFSERCVNCHSRDAAAVALRLDTYEGAIAGSENGAVLVPGDASASELIRRLRGASLPRMPFLSSPMPADEIALIESWIAAGLPEGSPATARPRARRANHLTRAR